jgi:predicted N-acyltransferase
MLAERMPDNVLLVIAERDGPADRRRARPLRRGALYGRYWGASEHVPGLHFEACYYQALEFCIERGIALFEGGAQGEHKHARGFLPEPRAPSTGSRIPPSSARSTITSRARARTSPPTSTS